MSTTAEAVADIAAGSSLCGRQAAVPTLAQGTGAGWASGHVKRFRLPAGLSRAGCSVVVLCAVSGFAVGGEGAFAGVGQGAEVELGGGDVSVSEAFFDDLYVGAAGQ